MGYDPKEHHRKSVRLKGFDYSRPGHYFVTIVSWNKECLFGRIHDGAMELNAIGFQVQHCWKAIPDHFSFASLDEYVVMPNHIHGIIHVREWDTNPENANGQVDSSSSTRSFGKSQMRSVSVLVRSFKSATTKAIRELVCDPDRIIWQRNYYEHIIRSDRDLNRVRDYIWHNPIEWDNDDENPDYSGMGKQG